MHVIEVIPLRKGIGISTLSYFGSDAYPVGALLSIPVRNQTILGLVTEVKEVSAAKTALRAATFSLRKLPPQERVQSLTPTYVKTAQELAVRYGTHVGSVLANLLPPEIQHGDIALPHTMALDSREVHLPEVFQAKKEERMTTYRSIVRETFAHASSVLLVVPATIDAEVMRRTLGRGIEERVIVLTSQRGKRELRDAYEKLEDFSHAKLIIATPSHAMVERHDIATTIIEESRSPHYRERTRPYLDHRDVITIHSREAGRRLIIGDILPRTEDEYQRREEKYHTLGETPKRIALPGTLSVHVRKIQKGSGEKLPFFSSVAEALIREVKRKKRHLFMFSARRGLAPIVVCGDCGYVFRSEKSGAPFSLMRTKKDGVEERWFICGTSGDRIRALDTCPRCNSWRLKERGIGIQYVHDELRALVPETPIIVFDHTTATTWKRTQSLHDAFYSTKGAILLGTYMALPYLTDPIDDALIVSMDALLTTPTWRLDEENLALLLRLREITRDTVTVETGEHESDVLSYAKHGEVERFYTDELELRKSLSYPPYSHFIHLTWQGGTSESESIEERVKTLLSPWNVSIYPSPLVTKEGPVRHALIRVPESDWPLRELSLALMEIPPSVRIVHNPDRII